MQGEQAADLATFMNDRKSFDGTATVPPGARVFIQVRGSKIVSAKLINENLNLVNWNITPAQETASAA